MNEKRYYEFVREERQFCAILAHLLMQGGPNLKRFLELADREIRQSSRASASLNAAEIYIEFAYLRDHWNDITLNNSRSDANAIKRELIMRLFAACGLLDTVTARGIPDEMGPFNEIFMGIRGARITKDIVYPGQWSIAALDAHFGECPALFQQFCRFKWAFNIKPDIVIMLPNEKPLCVEAKVESKEGQYPASLAERLIFDTRFGKEQGRVNQVELQQFMFDRLLATPCDSLIIGRRQGHEGVPFLSWNQTFDVLDFSQSIEFVDRLRDTNVHLRARGVAFELPPVTVDRTNLRLSDVTSFAEGGREPDPKLDDRRVNIDHAGLPLDAEDEEILDRVWKEVLAEEETLGDESA